MVSYKHYTFIVLIVQCSSLICFAVWWWGYFEDEIQPTRSPKVEPGFEECLTTVIETDPSVEFPLIASRATGRRFIAGVVTLRSSMQRKLPLFMQAWKEVWPDVDFRVSVGFPNSPMLKGLGCMASLYRLCTNAQRFAKEFDYLILMTDDAKPYKNSTWPADLDAVLARLESADGSGLLLGGRHVEERDERALRTKVGAGRTTIGKAQRGFGTHAMVIPKKHLIQLACQYEAALQKKSISSELDGQENLFPWNQLGGSGYVAAPLLVDHRDDARSHRSNKLSRLVMPSRLWSMLGS